jgi:hypothetical protein
MFKKIRFIYRKIYLAFWILGFYFDTGKITYNVSQLDGFKTKYYKNEKTKQRKRLNLLE